MNAIFEHKDQGTYKYIRKEINDSLSLSIYVCLYMCIYMVLYAHTVPVRKLLISLDATLKLLLPDYLQLRSRWPDGRRSSRKDKERRHQSALVLTSMAEQKPWRRRVACHWTKACLLSHGWFEVTARQKPRLNWKLITSWSLNLIFQRDSSPSALVTSLHMLQLRSSGNV